MKKLLKLTALFSMIFLSFSCSINQEEYKKNQPNLNIKEYLNGNLEAFGIVKNWRGKVIRRFNVKMKGVWNDNQGVLTESFIFDDGKTEERNWLIDFKSNNKFTAKAKDVIGVANGTQIGNSLKMIYILEIQVDGKPIEVKVEDWMYLINENQLINESKLKKFGITVGYLTIGFNKIKD